MAKTVTIRMDLKKTAIGRGLADVKAGFDMVYGAATKVSDAVDDVMTSGQKLDQLYRHNTLSIKDAAQATKGYVSTMQLLTAANTAAEFQLGMTSKEFGKFATFAVIQAQKLGGDANKMLDDLIRGTARGSKMILDNLGLIVKEGASVQDVTAAINAKMGDQAVEVASAGDKWLVMKTRMGDAWEEMKRGVTQSGILAEAIDALTKGIEGSEKVYEKGWKETYDNARRRAALTEEWTNLEKEFAETDWGPWKKSIGTRIQAIKEEIQVLTNAANAHRFYREMSKGMWGVAGGEERIMPEGYKDPAEQKVASGYGGKTAKKTKSNDFTAPSFTATEADADRATAMLAQQETLPVLNEMLRDYDTASVRAGIAAMNLAQKQELAANAAKNQSIELKSLSGVQKMWADDTRTMALGALKDLTTGFVQSIDAVVMGQSTFGEAMLMMLKQLSFSVMAEAAAHAIKMVGVAMEFTALSANPFGGQAWIPAATAAWASAGKWAAIAAGAGVAGIATSVGMKAAGMGGSSSKESDSSSSSSGSSRTTFGTRTDSDQPININVYIGDPGNPSTAILITKQIEAKIKKAA